jgi:hypothetical protein
VFCKCVMWSLLDLITVGCHLLSAHVIIFTWPMLSTASTCGRINVGMLCHLMGL